MHKTILRAEDPALFDRVRWALLARAQKDPARPALECLKIEVDEMLDMIKLVGCDGHRLHIISVPLSDHPNIATDGLFQVTKLNKSECILTHVEEELEYPDYELAIPDYLDKDSQKLSVEPADVASRASTTYTKMIRAMRTNVTLNYEFFKQLLEINKDTATLTCSSVTDISGVFMEAEEYRGVLMPIFTGEEEEDTVVDAEESEREESDTAPPGPDDDLPF